MDYRGLSDNFFAAGYIADERKAEIGSDNFAPHAEAGGTHGGIDQGGKGATVNGLVNIGMNVFLDRHGKHGLARFDRDEFHA